ncbi:MAG: hypothetical protein DMF85_02535 [Acidobacteria bacterium]|nr:MAG: hypothetical protein DMF85_02535 [Acidobacteriota bacterium]
MRAASYSDVSVSTVRRLSSSVTRGGRPSRIAVTRSAISPTYGGSAANGTVAAPSSRTIVRRLVGIALNGWSTTSTASAQTISICARNGAANPQSNCATTPEA